MQIQEIITESYQLDEGLGDWIEKKMDKLLGNERADDPINNTIGGDYYRKVRGDKVAALRAQAPADIPDEVAKKLVAAFLVKRENEALLAQAAEAQKTTVEKLEPYLLYIVGNFVERWKRISQQGKQQIFKDLAMGVIRLIVFVLHAMVKSKR
jgi:hypothetical protein